MFEQIPTNDQNKRKQQADFLYGGLFSLHNFFYQRWLSAWVNNDKKRLIASYYDIINTFLSRINTHIFGGHEILNINKSTQNWINKYRFESRMTIKDLNIARIRTLQGLSAYVLLPDFITKKIFVDTTEVIGYPHYENDKLVDIYLTKNQPFKMDDNLIECYHYYLNKEKQVVLETIPIEKKLLSNYRLSFRSNVTYYSDRRKIITKYIQLNEIPVVISPNNEDYWPDWSYVSQYIYDYAVAETEVIREWHFTKWRQLNNKIINPDKDSKELEKTIVNDEDGNRFIENDNDESLMGQDDFRYLSNGSLSVDIIQTLADRKRDTLMKIALQINNIASRNNKQTTEVIGNNIHPFNYLDTKRQLFEECLQKFYQLLLSMTKKFKFQGHELITLPTDELIEVKVNLKRSTEILMGLVEKSQEKGVKSMDKEKIEDEAVKQDTEVFE